MKKHDQPYFPLYPGDWLKCPEVRALSLEARMAWLEMLLLMWESTERGYLTLAGKPMDRDTLARCLGFARLLLDRLLAEMEQYNVYSVREDGAIYNRRMVRDAEISSKRAIAGHKGGICSSKTASKKQANAEDEDEAAIDNDSDKRIASGGSGGDCCTIPTRNGLHTIEGPSWDRLILACGGDERRAGILVHRAATEADNFDAYMVTLLELQRKGELNPISAKQENMMAEVYRWIDEHVKGKGK